MRMSATLIKAGLQKGDEGGIAIERAAPERSSKG